MAGLLTYTLATESLDARRLRDTLGRYNRACEHISEFAITKNEFVSNRLDESLADLLRGKFLLPSGLAKTAVQRVSKNYHDIPVRQRSKRDNMPHYQDGRIVIYNKDTASLLMRAMPVNHTAEFPIGLSLAVSNDSKGKSRRILVRFDTHYEPEIPDTDVPTMRLTFNEKVGKWQFLVVIKELSDRPRREFLLTADSAFAAPEDLPDDYVDADASDW